MKTPKTLSFTISLSLALLISCNSHAEPFMQCSAAPGNKNIESYNNAYRVQKGAAAGAIIYKTLTGTGGELEFQMETAEDRDYPWLKRNDDFSQWEAIVFGMNPEQRMSKDRGNHCVYQTAVDYFNKIKDELGPKSPYLNQWLGNQIQVFNACGAEREDEAELNLETKPSEPARAAKDRQYQEASFYFYKKDFNKAQELYQKIYKTQDHPYRGQAAYMIARSMSQAKEYTKAYDCISELSNDVTLSEFLPLFNEYKFILSSKPCPRDQFDACIEMNKKQLSFIRKNILELGQTVDKNKLYLDSVEQLDHYLQRKITKSQTWWFSASDETSPRLNAYATMAQTDEFLDWMQAYYATNPGDINWRPNLFPDQSDAQLQNGALDHSIKRWKSGDGDEWLYIAALRIFPDHPAFKEIHTAAEQLFKKYQCAGTQSGKILIRQLWPHIALMRIADGLSNSFIQELTDTYEGSGESLNYQDSNSIDNLVQLLLYQKRYIDIRKLAEAFVHAGKYNRYLYKIYINFLETPAKAFKFIATMNVKHRPATDGLQSVSLYIMNRLSVADILEMLENNIIPASIKAPASRVSFVRAILLDDKKLFVRAARQVAQSHPFLKKDVATMLDDSNDDPQAQAVTAFLLEHPRFNLYATQYNVPEHLWKSVKDPSFANFDRIDVYNHNDNNWWCKLDLAQVTHDLDRYTLLSPYLTYSGYPNKPQRELLDSDNDPAGVKSFFDYAHSDEWIATNELQALALKPNGPEYLTRQSIAQAEAKSSLRQRLLKKIGITLARDAAIPEMLHRSVVTTRYGCNRNEAHGAYSEKAFQILHTKYPESIWTQKTRYWFK